MIKNVSKDFSDSHYHEWSYKTLISHDFTPNKSMIHQTVQPTQELLTPSVDMIDMSDDIYAMHRKFGVHKAVNELSLDKKLAYLKFRLNFVQEEVTETLKAFDDKDAEEIVDGLIDTIVVAIGTLDAFGINTNQAWREVLYANMSKEPGVNPNRPNEFGLPDLIKPEGWEKPSHEGNHGELPAIFNA